MEATPSFWVLPNAHQDLAPSDWLNIFDNPATWQNLLNRTNVFLFFEIAIPRYSNASLQRAVSIFKKNNITVGVEAIGLEPWACDNLPINAPIADRIASAAQETAVELLTDIQPIYTAGGSISNISMDASGIQRVVGPASRCNLDVASASQALAVFMKVVHARHPEIKFGLIGNFPSYVYNGTGCYFGPPSDPICQRFFLGQEYSTILNIIVAKVRAAGEQLYYLHVDNPYDFTSGHYGVIDFWGQRLLPLKRQATSLGLRFGLIVNSDLTGKTVNPVVDAQRFHDNILQDISNLVQAGVGDEQDFIVESWYTYPASILPETTPNTFTNTAGAAIASFLNKTHLAGKNSILGTVDGVIVNSDQTRSIVGWACARNSSQSISVDIYFGGAVGTPGASMFGRFEASQPSDIAVAAACQSGGSAYRFSVPISATIAQIWKGKPVYVYGISTLGLPNSLLANSGTTVIK